MPHDPRIFRAYDIRGRAHDQLTDNACRDIGHAFGLTLHERYGVPHPHVIVGRDARTHGPQFEDAIVEGLLKAGCHIERIGPTPSPVNYFTICGRHADGGIHVTASHNPPHDNGVKLQTRDADAFAGDDIQTLARRIDSGGLVTRAGGTSEDSDAATPYIEHITELFKGIGKGMTIVIDAGNGIAGPVNCEILKNIGCMVHELYTEPDGNFPNHLADPSKADTLKELQAAVRTHKAACGFGFDGDGDRLGLVDETGTIRSADDVLLLLAQDHLERFPGKPVVFTVSGSGVLGSEIKRWGGIPVMCAVGHSFVEHVMRERGSLLGGEQSGHFFCGEDYYGFDDAFVAALRILKIMQKHPGRSLSSLFADFPQVYQTQEIRPHCPDERKAAIVASVSDHFAKTYPVNRMDGVRIDFGDGAWAGIRQSNTSPKLSICIEARTPAKLKEVESIVIAQMKNYPELEWDE